ncbi:hypothetical protein CBP31_06160 [Oceanisphaera profunda]|uniref:Transposase DDE domain-containing protein n=1 Tax=Oceanisphaera profunda TaxID=1416627 RepID=A0A1Y0D407_9GAMM|nr:hypothetical protein CBP31_06160 [Oceanisphaera profunda]
MQPWMLWESCALTVNREQASEYGQVEALLEGFIPGQVLADKVYVSDAFVERIQDIGAEAVIPSKRIS